MRWRRDQVRPAVGRPRRSLAAGLTAACVALTLPASGIAATVYSAADSAGDPPTSAKADTTQTPDGRAGREAEDRGGTSTGAENAPPPSDAAPAPAGTPDPVRTGAPEDTAGDPFPGLGGESPSCRTATGDAARNCRGSGSIAHRYPIGNYGFDIHIDTGFDAPSGSFFSAIQNVLQFAWQALLYVVKGVLLVLDWAFSLDLVNDNMADLRRGLDRLDRMFGDSSAFFLAAISCLGLWGIWRGFVQRQTIQTIGGLAASVGLMIAALVIIHNPVGTVGQVNAIANNGARSVAGTMADAGGGRNGDGLAGGTQHIFDAIVLRPWCALQFGDVDFCLRKPPMDANLYDGDANAFKDLARDADSVADLFLQFPANGTERNKLYENWKGDGKRTEPKVRMMQKGSTTARVALLALIAVGMLGAIALLAWLGFKLIGYAILALFLILIAPVMMLLAAFGESGRRTFVGWGKRLFVALIAEFLFAVLLGLVLFTADLLAGLNGIGWFGLWLIQTIFWWTAFLKRHEIVDWLTLGGGPARPASASPQIVRRLADHATAPLRFGVSLAGASTRRAGREAAVAVRHSRREGTQAAARTVLGRHAEKALDREYTRAQATLANRRRLQGELRAVEDRLNTPGLATVDRAKLRSQREALLEKLGSRDWRHAERIVQDADTNERELGQRWTIEDREKWAKRRRNELARGLPVDDPRNLLAAGIDPEEYEQADLTRRGELRADAQRVAASQEKLLRGLSAESGAPPTSRDVRAARGEIRIGERFRHQVREHRGLRRDAARRRAREYMYRPWR